MVLSRRYAEANLSVPGSGATEPRRRTSASSLLGMGRNGRTSRGSHDATLTEDANDVTIAPGSETDLHASHSSSAFQDKRLDRLGNFLRVAVPGQGFKCLRLDPTLTAHAVVADVCSKRGHDPNDHFLAVELADGCRVALLAGRIRVQSINGNFYLQQRARRTVRLTRTSDGHFGLTVGRLPTLQRALSTTVSVSNNASRHSNGGTTAQANTKTKASTAAASGAVAATEYAPAQGLYIVRVTPASCADLLGVEVGDQVLELDGQPVDATQAERVKLALRSHTSARLLLRSLRRTAREVEAASVRHLDDVILANVLQPPRPAAALLPHGDPVTVLRVPTPPPCDVSHDDIYYPPREHSSTSEEAPRPELSTVVTGVNSAPSVTGSGAVVRSDHMPVAPGSPPVSVVAADTTAPEAGDPGIDFVRSIAAFVRRTDEVSRFLRRLVDEETAAAEDAAEDAVEAEATAATATASANGSTRTVLVGGSVSPGTAAATAAAAAAAVALRRRARAADDLEISSVAPSPVTRTSSSGVSGVAARSSGDAMDALAASTGSGNTASSSASMRRRCLSTSAMLSSSGSGQYKSGSAAESAEAEAETRRRRKERGKLRATLRELLETEESYIVALQLIVDRYLIPMQREALLSRDAFAIVQGNTHELLAFQRELLAALQDATQPALSRGAPTAGPVAIQRLTEASMAVADVFDARVEGFKVYAQYCSTHARAVEIISSPSNMALRAWLDARNPRQDQSATLASYLIKPVQRVLKYPLLLRELASHLGESPTARQRVSTALGGLSRLAEHINNMTRLCDYYERELERGTHGAFALSRNFHQLLHYCELRWLNALDDRNKPRVTVNCTLLVFRSALALVERLPPTKAERKRLKAGQQPRPRFLFVGMFRVRQINKVLRGLDHTVAGVPAEDDTLCWRLYVEPESSEANGSSGGGAEGAHGNIVGNTAGNTAGGNADASGSGGSGFGGGLRQRLGALSPKLTRRTFGGDSHAVADGATGEGSSNTTDGDAYDLEHDGTNTNTTHDEAERGTHRPQLVPPAAAGPRGPPLAFYAFRMESDAACSACMEHIRAAQRAPPRTAKSRRGLVGRGDTVGMRNSLSDPPSVNSEEL